MLRINKVAARLKKRAPIAVRINPNVEANTHSKITTGTYENKFGIPFEHVEAVYARASKLKNIWLRGVQMHIGSQMTDVTPFELAVKKVLPLVRRLAEKYELEFFSLGGGLGIIYSPALASGAAAWWKTAAAKEHSDAGQLRRATAAVAAAARPENPASSRAGSSSGNAGVLVTRVEYVKRTGKKNFVIVDAAMNDLIRPAFYDSYHEIVPLKKKPRRADVHPTWSAASANPAIISARTVRCRKSAKATPSGAVERGRLRLGDGVAITTRARWRRRFWSAAESLPSRANGQAGERNLGGRKSCVMVEIGL